MIKIYVVCHRPTYVPKNSIFYPVQAGSALAEARYEGMLYDDSGVNISEKNRVYCELTVQYWAWKNEDADYYGFFHYRRYLSFTKLYPVGSDGHIGEKKRLSPYVEMDQIPEDLNRYGLTPETISQTVEKYDIITVLRERLDVTVYRQYQQYHDPATLDQVVKILKQKYPAFSSAADEYLSSKEIYYMNMFIMKKELFMEYCNWLFDILGTYEKQYMQKTEIPLRIMGYLAERLFGIFYTYQIRKHVRCAEVPYIRFYDTWPEGVDEQNKEGKESYREFRIGYAGRTIKINMRRFNRLFPAGSRRRLLFRSIFLRKS